MKKFSTYQFKKDEILSICKFFPANNLNKNLPISTPFTFPFIENKVVLAFDKNKWWNPPGGHIEYNENWKKALIRETKEEVGVIVNNFIIVGYIKIKKIGNVQNLKYPRISILPITYSYVQQIMNSWKPLETSKRMFFNEETAINALSKRNDNLQMLEIFRHVISRKKKEKLNYKYSYIENKILSNIPVTQVYIFCYNSRKKFCIVRDSGENHYSLPGGSVELGEFPEDAAKRELMEETQITCNKLKLLGTNVVSYFNKRNLIEQVQQIRYLTSANNIPKFKKNYKGFETEERLFVSLKDLSKYIKWLNEPLPQKMLKQISQLII